MNAPEQLCVMKWTAVDVSLPDDEMTVILALADGEVWTGFHLADGWYYVSGDPIGCHVTHWCELPEPPK